MVIAPRPIPPLLREDIQRAIERALSGSQRHVHFANEACVGCVERATKAAARAAIDYIDMREGV